MLALPRPGPKGVTANRRFPKSCMRASRKAAKITRSSDRLGGGAQDILLSPLGRGSCVAGAREDMMVRQLTLWFAVAVWATLAGAATAQDKVTFTNLEALLREKPLRPGGPTAEIVATRPVDARDP